MRDANVGAISRSRFFIQQKTAIHRASGHRDLKIAPTGWPIAI
jgi:hypothetical protein